MKKNKQLGRFTYMEIELAEGKFNPNAYFEIITTAKQTDSRYGDFQYKKEELQEMADNFNNEVVGTEIPLDLNHDGETIALGWLVPGSMIVKESTKLEGEYSLYVKLHKFTPRGEELISTGAVKYFSIELQFKFQKFVKGVKKLFKNVIRGLALTNTPVVKDMSPTFSEKYKSSNPYNMDDLKKLFSALKAKNSITKLEFSEFKKLADEAVEADEAVKEEVEAQVGELESKVEEEKSTDEEKELAEAKSKKLAEEATERLLKEKGKKIYSDLEVKALAAEIANEVIKEPLRKLNEMFVEGRTTQLSAKVDKLCLSEDRNVGFKSDSKGKILDFVKKLSDELAKEYFELHSDIIANVDLAEYGRDDIVKSLSKDELYKELNEKVEKKMSEDKTLTVGKATQIVLSEDKNLAEKLEKIEE